MPGLRSLAHYVVRCPALPDAIAGHRPAMNPPVLFTREICDFGNECLSLLGAMC